MSSCVAGVPSPGASLEAGALGTFKKASFQDVYQCDEKNGEGAFGTVYKTHHVSKPEETFAVKVMYRDCVGDEQILIAEVTILNIYKVFRMLFS